MNQNLSAVQHKIFSASGSSHNHDKGAQIHHIYTYTLLKPAFKIDSGNLLLALLEQEWNQRNKINQTVSNSAT